MRSESRDLPMRPGSLYRFLARLQSAQLRAPGRGRFSSRLIGSVSLWTLTVLAAMLRLLDRRAPDEGSAPRVRYTLDHPALCTLSTNARDQLGCYGFLLRPIHLPPHA